MDAPVVTARTSLGDGRVQVSARTPGGETVYVVMGANLVGTDVMDAMLARASEGQDRLARALAQARPGQEVSQWAPTPE